jgi:hypothetical protein
MEQQAKEHDELEKSWKNIFNGLYEKLDRQNTRIDHLLAERSLLAQRPNIGGYYPTEALFSILQERLAQDAKWGEQNHDPFLYLTILGEEYGELCNAALETRFGGDNGGLDNLRTEAVQTAAVAMAVVECLDRRQWTWADETAQSLKSYLDKSKEEIARLELQVADLRANPVCPFCHHQLERTDGEWYCSNNDCTESEAAE